MTKEFSTISEVLRLVLKDVRHRTQKAQDLMKQAVGFFDLVVDNGIGIATTKPKLGDQQWYSSLLRALTFAAR